MGCNHCDPTPSPVVVYVDLTPVLARLDTLEALMATAAEQINALSAKVDAQTALITDIQSDFAALVAALAAERENLTESGQAALDAASAKVDANATKLAELDVAVGDADGSDAPPPVDTEEPPVEEPTEPETPAEPVA